MRIRSLSWFITECWFETNKCRSSNEEAPIDAWLALELQRLSSCTLFSGRLWFVYWAIRRFTDNLFSLGHAWLSLWSENMITGRINQFTWFEVIGRQLNVDTYSGQLWKFSFSSNQIWLTTLITEVTRVYFTLSSFFTSQPLLDKRLVALSRFSLMILTEQRMLHWDYQSFIKS